MSVREARVLLRDYCRPSNFLHLMEELAIDRGIDQADIQPWVDSGEFINTRESGFTIETIRRNPDYKVPVSMKAGIDKAELLAAIDPVTVFKNELNTTVRDSRWQSTLCPFHEERTPSFRIMLPNGGYHCQACGESGGDIISFVMALHHLNFPTAIDYLAKNYTNIQPPDGGNSDD